jgi:hypothetical protein
VVGSSGREKVVGPLHVRYRVYLIDSRVGISRIACFSSEGDKIVVLGIVLLVDSGECLGGLVSMWTRCVLFRI